MSRPLLEKYSCNMAKVLSRPVPSDSTCQLGHSMDTGIPIQILARGMGYCRMKNKLELSCTLGDFCHYKTALKNFLLGSLHLCCAVSSLVVLCSSEWSCTALFSIIWFCKVLLTLSLTGGPQRPPLAELAIAPKRIYISI